MVYILTLNEKQKTSIIYRFDLTVIAPIPCGSDFKLDRSSIPVYIILNTEHHV